MTVAVRRETHTDGVAVRDVVTRAFAEDGQQVAALVEALRRHDAGRDDLGWVATDEGAVVGHVLFTHSWLDAPDRLVDVLVLSPLGVAPERQGAGVGTSLVRHALAELATQRREPLVFLEGSPDYYSRFGFRPGAELGFRRPSLRIPAPGFQVLALPAYQPWMTGTLVYNEVFWAHDCVGLRDPELIARLESGE